MKIDIHDTELNDIKKMEGGQLFLITLPTVQFQQIIVHLSRIPQSY